MLEHFSDVTVIRYWEKAKHSAEHIFLLSGVTLVIPNRLTVLSQWRSKGSGGRASVTRAPGRRS